jgi:leader peptidase (prepilin peptidase)/N-methyltransferase
MALFSVGVAQMTLLANPPTLLYGLTTYFIWFAFIFGLLTAGLIDLDTFLLPDAITVPGVVVGILASVFIFDRGWIDPVVAAAGSYAAVSLLFVRGYKTVTGKQGMGEGDPKLLAMIGAFLMLEGVLFALFAGAVQGLIVGSILVVHRRRTGSGPPVPAFEEEALEDGDEAADDEDDSEILPGDEEDEEAEEESTPFRKAKVPFGPFLALGAIEYYFFGQELLALYTGLVSRLVLGVWQ